MRSMHWLKVSFLGKITICQILNITDVFKVFCVCLNKEGTDVIWTGSGSMNEKYPGRNDQAGMKNTLGKGMKYPRQRMKNAQAGMKNTLGKGMKYPRQGNEIPQARE